MAFDLPSLQREEAIKHERSADRYQWLPGAAPVDELQPSRRVQLVNVEATVDGGEQDDLSAHFNLMLPLALGRASKHLDTTSALATST
jgi:hypothetical protein